MPPRRTIVALALAAVAACSGPSAVQNTGPAKPLDATFERFDGTSGTLAQYRGKPLLVNFFSSTCLPCRTEMPALEQVHGTLGAQMTFLGIDVQDTVEGGKAFIDTVGITWELGRDPDGEVLQATFGGTRLPTTTVLDAEGKIAFTSVGPLDVEHLTQKLRENHLIP